MKKWQQNVSSEVTQLKDVLTYYWHAAALAAGLKARSAAAERFGRHTQRQVPTSLRSTTSRRVCRV